jgi:hypothetical protein
MTRHRLAGWLSVAASSALLVGLSAAAGAGDTAHSAGEHRAEAPLKDREIAYVMTNTHWAMYETPGGKEECPDGLNDGPREQFNVMFPDNGTKFAYRDTAMTREIATWFPTTGKDEFPYREAQGKHSYGLNLDGKIGPNDFISPGPEGERGIDNQLYRAIGCVGNYRLNGTLNIFINNYMQQYNYNRVVIELTNVDSLTNDDDVTVSIYRGLNHLLTDGTGNDFVPGGSQRLDLRWGKEFIRHFHGKIVNGVLMTEPVDAVLPAMQNTPDTTVERFKGMQLRLNLTSEHAEGVLAGYVDIETFYRQMNEAWSTTILAYGQQSPPSIYKALRRLADGYPDPKTGQNTAISGALNVDFAQAFIVRDTNDKVALSSGGKIGSSKRSQTAQ